MTAIIAPVAPTSQTAFLALCRQAKEQGATHVELRLDMAIAAGAQAQDLLAGIRLAALPILATCRMAAEEGQWKGSEEERLKLLLDADAAGAAIIDVELAALKSLPSRPKMAQLLVSSHDFHGMGGDLQAKIRAMFAAGADIAKVAVTPNDAADSAPLLNLPKCFPGKNVIAIGMGEFGLITRVAPGIVGAWGTFGRLDAQGSAPGQLPVLELACRYRVKTQSPATKIYAVLGDPVAHSIGPALHNAAMQAVDHDGIYLPLRMKDLVSCVTALREYLAGCSITIPHKETALEIADSQDADVQAIGAANTFVFAGGRIIASNTDAPAIRSVLTDAAGNLSKSRVLILGAGGVARAAIGALRGHVASITIANRTLARAEELGRHFGITAISLDQAMKTEHDILINCTSVGMGDPKNSPWPQEAHRSGRVVFDTVYVPMKTRLLREAKSAGATPVSGLEMFLAQAAAQFKLWTGKEAPLDIMRTEALKALAQRHG